MDTSTTIIGLVILALFVIPVMLLSRSGKNKSKRLLNDLKSEALNNELVISDCDSWNESALGIDEQNNKIIFIDDSHGGREVKIFSLKDVKEFKTFPALTNKNYQYDDYEKENKLALSFIFKERLKSNIDITFFIAGFSRLSKNEAHLFEKWADIISKRFL